MYVQIPRFRLSCASGSWASLNTETSIIVILPLWSPGYVQLGDVGYLDKPAGEFKTLFNAFDPEHSSNGLMTNTGRLQGFGDLMTETVRMDKRSPAQRGYDAIQQLNPFKKTGPPTYVVF
jgi:abelson tyrosine-protein kinase 1